MATTLLKYDARNANAKKTLDYILSLGFFEEIESTGLGKPVVNQLSLKEKRYLSNLKKVAKDIRENKNSEKYKTWEEFVNEV